MTCLAIATSCTPVLCHIWAVLQEYSDAMLSLMMSSITKGLHSVNEMVDKFNMAYDKLGRRRPPM